MLDNIVTINKDIDNENISLFWQREDVQVGPFDDWPLLKEEWFKHIENFNTVVQAGGWIGLYPKLLAKYFKTVYTFEPDWLNFYCLSNNCTTNNIVKMQCALGDIHNMVSYFREDPGNSGSNAIDGNLYASDNYIPMITIDSLNLNNCDFIQLDVEGYEVHILEGAKGTIRKFKPLISTEVRGGISTEIYEFMKKIKYKEVVRIRSDVIWKA